MADGKRQPQPGDLIEIDRGAYQHWALYVGNGYVIHVTDQGTSSSSGSIASVWTSRAMVKKELLMDVAGKDNWRVNNKHDRSRKPRRVKEIIRRAEHWVGKEVPYDVLTSNCEHFVTELRYGDAVSDQADNAVVGGAAAAIGGVLSAAAALTMLALSRR